MNSEACMKDQPNTQEQVQRVIAYVCQPPHREGKTGAFMWNHGYVLSVHGEAVELELRSQGHCLDDWLIYDPTPDDATGIFVWEGVCENWWQVNAGGVGDPHFVGEWRRPTAVELWAIVGGPRKASEGSL
jgi:hypothetical protein